MRWREAREVKVPAAEPDDLGFIPRAHMVGGQN